ncbi:DUF3445 domain-containing protein [Pseudahrensia aquimaris]|uniref:DUF3445 domain-containing protein n=1 Tax=Pseudahrensia aquimaris TaxID=744461 RepID=A0ABW3FJG4_9HYPH
MQFQPFTTAPSAFGIGLKPLTPGHALHQDGEAERYRAEKIALYRSIPNEVVRAQDDTLEAQQEIKELVAALTSPYANQETLEAEFSALGPMAVAALGIQDDLILMRRSDDGWRLAAASLCFPSSWNLSEKFGHPLEVIHQPVPHMAGKTGERIRRIFDMLRPEQPLWRENWAIEGDDELRHERKLNQRGAAYKADKLAGTVHIRCEYQTLHKLPLSDDVLFTVKILVRSVSQLAATPNGRAYLQHLVRNVDELSEEGLAYKGLAGNRERLKTVLAEAIGA